jgi:hypothetical protein
MRGEAMNNNPAEAKPTNDRICDFARWEKMAEEEQKQRTQSRAPRSRKQSRSRVSKDTEFCRYEVELEQTLSAILGGVHNVVAASQESYFIDPNQFVNLLKGSAEAILDAAQALCALKKSKIYQAEADLLKSYDKSEGSPRV